MTATGSLEKGAPVFKGGPDRCRFCGNNGVDNRHRARCEYLGQVRLWVEDAANEAGVTPTAALDLFAHMRTISDDGELAFQRTMTVLDLGWRPAVPAS